MAVQATSLQPPRTHFIPDERRLILLCLLVLSCAYWKRTCFYTIKANFA
jgi:hypothetical protein